MIPPSREALIIPTLRTYLETAATNAGFTADFGTYSEVPRDNPSGGIGYAIIASRGSFETTFRIDFYLMLQSKGATPALAREASLADSANLLAFYRDGVMDALRQTGAAASYQGKSYQLFRGIAFDSCTSEFAIDKAQSKCVWRYIWKDGGFVVGGFPERWANLGAPLE